MENKEKHVSVLKREVIKLLKVDRNGLYVDGTVGSGGHAEAILEASSPNGVVIGIDQDDCAVSLAKERLKKYGDRLHLIHGNFVRLAEWIQAMGVHAVNGIVLDLGVSSMQLDDPARGFSFQSDGPLDMRMDQGMSLMASHVVNRSSERELTRIFDEYGEERYARRIARAIVLHRRDQLIMTTNVLRDVIQRAVPSQYRFGRVHCATRVFQSLRIVVNNELEVLSRGIDQAVSLLALGGRLSVIAFHSLEDRVVKHRFRAMARAARPTVIELLKKPLRPSDEERRDNRRSRSAKLRGVERVVS